MSQSFKLNLFIKLTVLVFLLILVNRFIAQTFLVDQTENTILSEMSNDLKKCKAHFGDNHQFIHCAQEAPTVAIFNSMKAHYVVCPMRGAAAQGQLCESFHASSIQWVFSRQQDKAPFTYGISTIDDVEWLAVQNTTNLKDDVILLERSWIKEYVKQAWALRDQNLLKALPVILFMMIGLALFLAYSSLKPVKMIAEKMASLNSQNLSTKQTIHSPYKEFDLIVEQFVSLRERLAHSFEMSKRFSADVSHELRTPLSVLRGATERTIAQLPVGSDAQIQVRQIGDEIERLIKITEKLLLLSNADANILKLDLRNICISDTLEKFIKDVRTFQSHLTIKQHIEKGVHWECDSQLIHQLLQNLYTNAVKYNQPEGWISIHLRTSGQFLQLTIENTAAEIPVDLEALAFDRFYRGDTSRSRVVEGLGLGLSICQEIARVHQGELTLRVTPEQTVCLELKAPLTAKG
jgi:signal transduction histidine kinase